MNLAPAFRALLTTTLTLAPLLAPTQTKLGGAGPGGGVIVVQETGPSRFLDVVRDPRTTLLDQEFDQLQQSLKSALAAQSSFRQVTYYPNDLVDVASHNKAVVPRKSSSIGEAITTAFQSLTLYAVQGPLPKIDDRGVITLPWNVKGTLKQLAVQDCPSKTLLIDRDLLASLEPQDLPAFAMHEALIRVHCDDNDDQTPVTTEKIGNLVNNVFSRKNPSSNGISTRVLARYLNDANIVAGEKAHHGYIPLRFFTRPSVQAFPNYSVFIYRNGESLPAVISEATVIGSRFGDVYDQGMTHFKAAKADTILTRVRDIQWNFNFVNEQGTSSKVLASIGQYAGRPQDENDHISSKLEDLFYQAHIGLDGLYVTGHGFIGDAIDRNTIAWGGSVYGQQQKNTTAFRRDFWVDPAAPGLDQSHTRDPYWKR